MKITLAIHKLLKNWDREGYSPSSINTGCCECFAQELQGLFPKGRVMWGDDYPELFKTNVDPTGHCFFKYGKKFYDSESPLGVDYPDVLQYYQRQMIEDKEYWAKDKKENRKSA